jgi:hypothetical protein
LMTQSRRRSSTLAPLQEPSPTVPSRNNILKHLFSNIARCRPARPSRRRSRNPSLALSTPMSRHSIVCERDRITALPFSQRSL